MNVAELQGLARIIAERLLNTAAEGILLSAMAWLVVHLWRRQTSGTRFAIWLAALVAVSALPFSAGFSLAPSAFHAATNVEGTILLPDSWALALVAAWVIGAAFMLMRLLAGFWRIRQFRRSCSEVSPPALDSEIAQLLSEFKTRRKVKFCISGTVAIPAALGFLRPVIVFPDWLLPQLSRDETKLILLHELAHLHRWDDWTNLVQQVAKAVFFFHPAVWWIDRRLTLEREIACDEMVLAGTASPRAYASSLISFAEKLEGRRGLRLAQALVGRMQHMSERLGKILDESRQRRIGVWKPAVGLTAAMFALVLGAAPYMPRIVAFRTEIPVQSARASERAASQSTTQPRSETDDVVTLNAVAQKSALAQHVEAIPAVFHSPAAPTLPKKKSWQRQSSAIRARTQPEIQLPQTVVILRSTAFDASGQAVWTFCIWRVARNERAVESAVFFGSI